MSGILLSNRCQYCARRKIKCDEQWPTCGSCKQIRRECSGPPKNRFVHTDWQKMKALSAQKPKVNHLVSPQTPVQSLQQNTCSSNSTNTQSDKPSRAYFRSNKMSQKLRLQTITVGPPPPSPAEKLVAQLVGCVMSAEDVNFDASLSRRSCTILPKYMLTSDALCNAVKCMIACYLNHRRGLPAERLFDLKSYGRALRSLNQSLRDTNDQTSTSTLAAISIMHRAIVTYDFSRGDKSRAHLQGIHAIMVAQGPPKLQDDLQISLALDNFGILCNDSLLIGKQSVYERPEWQSAISNALESGIVQNDALHDNYRLLLRMRYWSSIGSKLRQIFQGTDAAEIVTGASSILEAAIRERDYMKMIDEQRIKVIRDLCMLSEHPDSLSPFLIFYHFSDLATAQCFVHYATVRIAINRAICLAMAIMGRRDMDIETENVELSHRIARCIEYARYFKPLGCSNFIQPLIVAFQSCNEAERKVIIDVLYEFEEYKNPPQGRWSYNKIKILCSGYDWRDLASTIAAR